MNKNLKLLLIGLGAAAIFFVFANSGYLWKNLQYTIVKPQPLPTPASEQIMEPDVLTIESLAIKAPVIYVDQADEPTIQNALINGVVHYPSTAKPGELGNDYIFGHSSDFRWSSGHYKTIFALLPKIEVGATITLSDSQGHPFTYIVTEKQVVAANDLRWLGQDKTKKILTLQTSYPLGTALKRFIVRAELLEPGKF